MEPLNTNINLVPNNYKCLRAIRSQNEFLDYVEIGTCFWDSWCHEKPRLRGIVVEPINIIYITF